MYYEGGLIFIDQEVLGLMSAYLHLSDIDVEEVFFFGVNGITSRRSDWLKSWFNGAFYWGSFGLARVIGIKSGLNPILFVK